MKKFNEEVLKGFRKARKFIVGVGATLSMAAMTAIPASATEINPNITTEAVVGGILDVVFKISMWLGIVITVIGVFLFLYSFKDDRADLQANGAKTAIVGAALLGLRVLIGMTGLIK